MSRLNEKEIEKQLENDLLNFYNSKYEGELPEWALENFDKALKKSKPNTHQIHVPKIRQMLGRGPDEVLVGEVGLITNVWLAVELEHYSDDFETALARLEELSTLTIKYNQEVFNFKTALEKKKLSLLSLVDTRNNGMRIVGRS